MANYKFKGTSINQILSQQGNPDFPAKYSGMDYTGGLSYNGWSMFRPLPIGYTINGVDISTMATATYTDKTSSGPLALSSPTAGANRVRYSLVGGGGGGGGGGGDAAPPSGMMMGGGG